MEASSFLPVENDSGGRGNKNSLKEDKEAQWNRLQLKSHQTETTSPFKTSAGKNVGFESPLETKLVLGCLKCLYLG